MSHRAAYAGGYSEINDSAVQPGRGEMLVETAVTLLRQAVRALKVAAGP